METGKGKQSISCFTSTISIIVQAISSWYSEQTGIEEEEDELPLQNKRWKKKWNLRKVVEQKNRNDIDHKINEDPGTGSYLKKYALAVSRVVDGLTDEQRERYMQMAREWNSTGPPRDVQIRFVFYNNLIGRNSSIFYSQGKKYAGSLALSFIEEMERNCGVKMVMFMGFVGKKGTLKYSR
jgi:hypothetical protein